MNKEFNSNWLYVICVLFYIFFFSCMTFGIALIFYLITIPLAFSPVAEKLWRNVSGVRPLRLKREKERLLPLFNEVYGEAVKKEPTLPKKINLYIHENMNINAFAFGRETLVLTRGSIDLLNDECIKGLISHELGHFANNDTGMSLFATVANLPLSFLVRTFYNMKVRNDIENRGLIGNCFKAFYDIFYYLFKGIQSIGDLILMHVRREHEYLADTFAVKSGYGKELADVLTEIYDVSISKPKSVKEQLNSSHPPITKRIEQIETVIY